MGKNEDFQDWTNTTIAEKIEVRNYYQERDAHRHESIATIIETRLRTRYLNPAEQVIESSEGFASIGICSFLIETIMCFREARESSNGI